MRVSKASHVGLVRELNEDSLCVWDVPGHPNHTLLVVADGMGGHRAGEVASELAVESLRRYLAGTFRREARNSGSGREAGFARRLLAGIRAANRRVYRRAAGRSDLSGMGTTIAAALVAEGRLYVANVGDSRIYLIRGRRIRQLTDDHSVVAELMKTGSLSEAEAKVHPQRHMLTRALGVERSMDIDVREDDLLPGDVLVLATDGLTALVSADEILSTVTNSLSDFERTADRLVELANSRGGPDNITVVVAAHDGPAASET